MVQHWCCHRKFLCSTSEFENYLWPWVANEITVKIFKRFQSAWETRQLFFTNCDIFSQPGADFANGTTNTFLSGNCPHNGNHLLRQQIAHQRLYFLHTVTKKYHRNSSQHVTWIHIKSFYLEFCKKLSCSAYNDINKVMHNISHFSVILTFLQWNTTFKKVL